MIEARNVTKRYAKVRALDNVSFTMQSGESLALWGSNGAGKTTLVRCILGVLRSRGDITVDGLRVRTCGKQVRARIGYVPQELAFHDDMRVGEAMRFFTVVRSVDRNRVGVMLERVGLEGQERKRVRDLSGGMKQRLALAVALLSDPPIIILDEPTSNLDAAGRDEVVDALRSLKTDGKTILFASHRPDEVLALADRMLLLDRGRIVCDTTPRELWGHEGAVLTMRLHIAGDDEEHAATMLRNAGHAVHLNGHGLCVAVERQRKADPIHTLTKSSVVVRDFEILRDVPAPGDEL
jgi:ABC-type multidrug transport system ATPase subunit